MEALRTQSAELVGGLSSIKEQMIMRMEAKELEAALKRANISLEKSNKLKDLFMDIMRHDLLNPAGVVRTSSQLALKKEKDVKKREILRLIERSSNRMIRMIENASILAKLESGEKIDFKGEDLGVMLKGSVEELSERAKAQGMIVKVVAKGKFPAVVNPLIQNIFSNFLSNAIKYSPEKTEITAGIKKKNGNWLVYVEDRGEGIPAKYKKAVFERFTRLEKGAIKGSGLGLAISKKIVGAHNGRIWVGDHKGGGSIFYVTVPKVHVGSVKPLLKGAKENVEAGLGNKVGIKAKVAKKV
jgi:signal transduction histidine kinase